MDEPGWPAEWQRSMIEFAILATIDAGETYGYLIANRLRDAGFGTIQGGTLYQILRRLESAGLVATEWREGSGGPGRKYYSMTPCGRSRVDQLRDQWREFSTTMSAIVNAEGS
ncbi:MAG TPA: PadR family transcriptional regulator [Jiangellaceae bacterium]|nr:PadR family transcriptional regulator [Jiangellaceae bacterium]